MVFRAGKKRLSIRKLENYSFVGKACGKAGYADLGVMRAAKAAQHGSSGYGDPEIFSLHPEVSYWPANSDWNTYV